MLITNFASGELSETLFGRTDLGQYYSGASRLENFDVIPTGGIKRRGGTERIPVTFKDENGQPIVPVRIVPFVLSRDEAYLVIFSNEKIIIYHVGEWDTPKEVFTNENITPETLYTEEEIPLIQHAQNFRTMVLAHKNHPPLQINFYLNFFYINIFNIFYLTELVHSADVVPKVSVEDMFDKVYRKENYLQEPGQYPGCVTFLNGRIVFASTLRNGQRLFFSRVNNINNFSTYKKYITEKKEYVTLRASVISGSTKIELVDTKEAEKLIASPVKYIVDSAFFKEGTRLLSTPYEEYDEVLKKSKIYIDVDNEAENLMGLDEGTIKDIRQQLTDKENVFNNKNNSKDTVIYNVAEFIYTKNWLFFDIESGRIPVNIKIGVSEAVIEVALLANSVSFKIDSLYALYFDQGNGTESLELLIKSYINQLFLKTQWADGLSYNVDILNYTVRIWRDIIMEYMKYSHPKLPAGPYYGYMPDIKTNVLGLFKGNEVYIPLYTKEQIEDNYPTADDGFTFEVASDRNDEIRWLVQNKNLIVGTESAEYVISSNITAVNVSAFLNSFYGSSKMQASSAGDAVLFFRDGQKGLVEYHIPEADNYFRTNNLLMMAPQMLSESEAVDFDVATMPYTMLIITRADGKLVTLLYDRSAGVFAWGRLTLGSGNAKSLAVIPGKSGYDDLYMLVEKDGSFSLELLEYDSEVYLDGFKQWDGDGTGYTDEAVIYDEEANKIYTLAEPPEPSDKRRIGYQYVSRIKSMPVIANNKMAPNNIKNLLVRFSDSYAPKVKALPNGRVDTVTCPEPYNGVWKFMFPGGWDRDVMFELFHEKPNRCVILAVYAEVE